MRGYEAWKTKQRKHRKVRMARIVFWSGILVLAEMAVLLALGTDFVPGIPNTIHESFIWVGRVYIVGIVGQLAALIPIHKLLDAIYD